jgi:hypothetical protein
MKLHILLFCGIVSLWGCSKNPVLPTESQVVVQAFLYDHEEVSDIFIGRSTSIGSTDSTNQPITTAVVTLQRNGTTYGLIADPARAGYYLYTGIDLTIATGDKFSLQVVADGTTATAETVVPEKPSGVTISQSVVTFVTDTITTPRGTMTRVVLQDTVNIQWSNTTDDLFYVVIRSIDSARTVISTDSMRAFPARSFVSSPTTASRYRLSESELKYAGRYSARVYHVNKEYADLYKSREQDSRDMTEPLTNVTNGLGVFSAFASDTVSFVVVKE